MKGFVSKGVRRQTLHTCQQRPQPVAPSPASRLCSQIINCRLKIYLQFSRPHVVLSKWCFEIYCCICNKYCQLSRAHNQSGMAIMAAFACFLHDCRCNASTHTGPLETRSQVRPWKPSSCLLLVPSDCLLFSCILMYVDCGPWLAEASDRGEGQLGSQQLPCWVLSPRTPPLPPPARLLIYSARY